MESINLFQNPRDHNCAPSTGVCYNFNAKFFPTINMSNTIRPAELYGLNSTVIILQSRPIVGST
jgi:hypothetical protein